MSALALATPAAIVPIPVDATNFTLTLAFGLICFQVELNPQLNRYHDEVEVKLK